jgi:hypothetical protein
MGKIIALHFENVSFLKKPSLYALKTLNLKLTLPSLGWKDVGGGGDGEEGWGAEEGGGGGGWSSVVGGRGSLT